MAGKPGGKGFVGVRLHQTYLGSNAVGDRASSWMPPVDIYETGDSYMLDAEVPGIAGKDLHIEVNGCDVTIRGERRPDPRCSKENYHRLEGLRGKFSRTFSLPEILDGERIQVDLEGGILHVRILKSSRSRRSP